MCDVGGGYSDSGSNQQSQSGFSQLPPELQKAWTQYGSQLTDRFSTDQSGAFTPTQLGAGEQTALSSMAQGYTPTTDTLKADISMQTNPFDTNVIDEINRQSAGENSALSSRLTQAGQFGSNRAKLGANDIDLSRLNQIGAFKQSQFDTALSNALTTLPALRGVTDTAALTGGAYNREFDAQTAQAPLSALSSYGSMLGVVPTSGGSTSSGTSESSSAQGSI